MRLYYNSSSFYSTSNSLFSSKIVISSAKVHKGDALSVQPALFRQKKARAQIFPPATRGGASVERKEEGRLEHSHVLISLAL